jgi:hypothetical protein
MKMAEQERERSHCMKSSWNHCPALDSTPLFCFCNINMGLVTAGWIFFLLTTKLIPNDIRKKKGGDF